MKNIVLLGLGVLTLGSAIWKTRDGSQGFLQVQENVKCGKIQPLVPDFNKSIELIFNDAGFRQESLARLSGAIRIPTEIEDTHPRPEDDLEYYAEFFKLHEYLEQAFPLVHKHLQLEKVNHVNLLYTWKGSDESLEPMMLTAHQDVVPVNPNTVNDWTYPPYSGHFDDATDFVWGRGSVDCKNLLVGELSAIEQLLKDGFQPKRSVIVALGFDEESSGAWGAQTMGAFLHDRYGDDGIYSIVDEGGAVLQLDKNIYAAAAITGEKGYVDVEVTVHGHGGHSSVPPDHTTIGIAAQLIKELEAHPFEPAFTPQNPFYGLLTCTAEHSSILPADVKKAILNAPFDQKEMQKMIDFVASDRRTREMLRTSQAVDIINGGVKANALPEVTSFLVNHRIDITSSVNETIERDLGIIKAIAQKFNLGLVLAGDEIIPESKLGYIDIKPISALEPAPLSPVKDSPVWDVFAGTIQNVFENGYFKDAPETEFYVTTALVSGNTDTKFYWPLTKNIYRFMGFVASSDLLRIIHSVNEHIPLSSHLSTIAFVYEYIVNVSENS